MTSTRPPGCALGWDPLDWHDRPPARATATGAEDDYEVLLYVPLEQTLATAATTGEEIAVVLGDLAASVLDVGAAHERIQRGWDSNRAGMDALLGTSSMLTQPTYCLPLALLRDLDDASHRVVSERPSRAELAGWTDSCGSPRRSRVATPRPGSPS